jgi:hypothetical protein
LINFRSSIADEFRYSSHVIKTRNNSRALTPVQPENFPLKYSGETSNGFEVAMKQTAGYKEIETCLHPAFNVHSPFEFPNVFDALSYGQFDYGESLEVLIIPKVIFTDESLVEIPPSRRNCYFDGERKLKYFKTYTKQNCETEFYADYMISKLNCSQYYIVKDKSVKVCDLDVYWYIRYSFNQTVLRGSECLERCNDVKYEIEIIQNSLKGEL